MSELGEHAARREAFQAEALPHLPRLFAAARRFAPPGMDVEDLVQEAMLRAYRTFESYEPGTNARAWLLTILYSVYVNRLRRWRREPQSRPDDELELWAERERDGEDWEKLLLETATAGSWGIGPTVEAALRRLPDDFREVVLLVDLGELTYAEAARALRCPVGTVRSRLYRARRLLALELRGYAASQGYAVEP
jgi:RNA polymerase sigma-70 factor (ECF subfamily)